MRLLKYLGFPVLIIAVGIIYWFVSDYETSGTVLLIIFGIAMGVMGWVLVPTFNDVGPTAPTDQDWQERRR